MKVGDEPRAVGAAAAGDTAETTAEESEVENPKGGMHMIRACYSSSTPRCRDRAVTPGERRKRTLVTVDTTLLTALTILLRGTYTDYTAYLCIVQVANSC